MTTPAQKNGSSLLSQNESRSRREPISQVRPSGDVAVIVVTLSPYRGSDA